VSTHVFSDKKLQLSVRKIQLSLPRTFWTADAASCNNNHKLTFDTRKNDLAKWQNGCANIRIWSRYNDVGYDDRRARWHSSQCACAVGHTASSISYAAVDGTDVWWWILAEWRSRARCYRSAALGHTDWLTDIGLPGIQTKPSRQTPHLRRKSLMWAVTFPRVGPTRLKLKPNSACAGTVFSEANDGVVFAIWARFEYDTAVSGVV